MGDVIEGRPDFRDRSFGVTRLKRFPPFVYSLLGTIPRPGVVECGRCKGEGAVFDRGLAERSVLRKDAKARIGCAMEAE